MYLRRLSSSGMSNNKYWYDHFMNHGAHSKNCLPNCTCYCVGRANEIALSDEPIEMFKSPYSPGGFPTAKDFLSCSLWDTGSEPRLGAIAVWGSSTDTCGHVATVESYDGNTITVSQSNFGGIYFEVKTYEVEVGKKTSGVGYVFQGFMYNPYVSDNRAARNKDTKQVDILADTLNVRKTPNGDKYTGRYATQGLYNVLDQVDAGGYRWLKVDTDCWIAQNDDDGWTETYEAESDSVVKELELKLEALTSEYKTLEAKYNEKVEEVNTINNNLAQTAQRLSSALTENKMVQTELDNATRIIAEAIAVLRG